MINSTAVVFSDYLLGSNDILAKSICLMWYFGAYDLIFLPYKNSVHVKIKLPIGSKFSFQNNDHIAKISHAAFINLKMAIKLSCALSILNDSVPKTCTFQVSVDSQKYAVRCAFHPTNQGEGLCIRIIQSSIFEHIDHVSNKLIGGLNIIGGRTCSGKTTLMYSSILNFAGHVITLEDPVEFLLDNVCQTDVSLLGYEEGIKSALRQNPDLICIGEIRDKKSAQAAIKAALTGHSVLATIHILSPEHLCSRLTDFGCEFFETVLANIFYIENFQRTDFMFKEGKIIKD